MKSRTQQIWNDLPTTNTLNPISSTEETEDDTKDEHEMENMMVSSLYFVEDKLFSTQTPLWGIRQPYRFEMI
jgi:hypothetical protein